MGGKKGLIILVGIAVLRFAGSLGVTLMMGKPGPKPEAPDKNAAAAAAAQQASLLAAGMPAETVQPKEKLLDDLVRELRVKIQDHQRKEQRMEEQETRIRLAQDSLDKQGKELENLRIQLVAPLGRLKEAQTELERSRVLVTQEERANLKKTAAIYEKMDATAGGKILEIMCGNKQEDDAAKILSYMSERSAAKLLAEITDKTIVARLCDRMKRIREEG